MYQIFSRLDRILLAIYSCLFLGCTLEENVIKSVNSYVTIQTLATEIYLNQEYLHLYNIVRHALRTLYVSKAMKGLKYLQYRIGSGNSQ